MLLSTQGALHNAAILVAFVALAVGVAVIAVRSSERTLPILDEHLREGETPPIGAAAVQQIFGAPTTITVGNGSWAHQTPRVVIRSG